MLCRNWSSCDEDVGDVGEEKLVDRAGTTNGTKSAVLHSIRLPFFDELWFLTTSPMLSITVIIAKFPSGRTAGVSSRSIVVTKKSNSPTYTVASCFVRTLEGEMKVVLSFSLSL